MGAILPTDFVPVGYPSGPDLNKTSNVSEAPGGPVPPIFGQKPTPNLKTDPQIYDANRIEQHSDGTKSIIFGTNFNFRYYGSIQITLSAVPTIAKYSLSNSESVEADRLLVAAGQPTKHAIWVDMPDGLANQYTLGRGVTGILLKYNGWANIVQM